MSKPALILPLLFLAAGSLQAVTSDLLPPTRRKVAVDLAATLVAPPVVLPVPSSVASPFNPAGYGQPDAEELEAQRKAQQAAQKAATAKAGPRTLSDSDLIKLLAEKLAPSGISVYNGETYMMFPGKRLRKGDIFVVTYDGRDFELEITDIQRTSFTLRYNNSAYTRPIKLGKNQ